jgi:uncharacterized membrane protein
MTLKKELPFLAIIILPFLYLAIIWNDLPDKVPMHWNISGEIDRYGDKSELIMIPFFLPILVYLIFSIVPNIDPKNKFNKMGNKFQNLKFVLTTFMSILTLFIFYTVKRQSLFNPNYVVLFIGALFIILGNCFKTIKPNYFLGIRTPWTLENEAVWKKTHNLGGKLWFIGGILVVLSSLIFDKHLNLTIFLIVTGIITFLPIAYSYVIFKNEKDNGIEHHF